MDGPFHCVFRRSSQASYRLPADSPGGCVNRAPLPAGAGTADELPLYEGIGLPHVCLVADEQQAAAALAALSKEPVLGFDTESKPTFLKGEVSTGPHLIQLATPTDAYLFQVRYVFNLPVIRAVLESPLIVKAGFGLGNDLSALRSRFGIALNNVIDLGETLRSEAHRGTVGAKAAVARYFGRRLQKSKKTGTSNWANRDLNERQLLYAANDAHVALKVYHAWQNEIASSDRGVRPSTLFTPHHD